MIGASVRRTSGWRGLLSLLLLAPVLLVACSDNEGRKGPSLGAGITGVSTSGDFQVVITLNPNSINKGQTVGITVTTQTARGVPVAGRRVNLTTTGGTLASVFGTTDPAGKFVTSLRVPPEYAGSNPITVGATADGVTATAQVLINDLGTLRIVPAGPVTLAPGDQQTFNCVGGVPPYRWEPSGGSLNTATSSQTIFTAGSAVGTFFLKCADSAGNSASVQINISLGAGGLTITPSGSVSLFPGQTQIFRASGGRRPYSWTATGGTPTSAGDVDQFTYTAGSSGGTFTVSLRDATGQTLVVSITIQTAELTFGPNIEVNLSAGGGGTCSVPAIGPVSLTAAGGTPPYSFFAGNGVVSPSSAPSSPATVTYNRPAGGTLDAGQSLNIDVVTVIDARGTRREATITVTCGTAPTP